MSTDPAQFSLSLWLYGERFDGIPPRVDNYRPGHITWGSNPAIGRRIQRARARKQRETNLAQFAAEILPTLSGEVAHDAALDYGRQTGDFSPAIARGWNLWKLGERASWIHETDTEKAMRARLMGAAISNP